MPLPVMGLPCALIEEIASTGVLATRRSFHRFCSLRAVLWSEQRRWRCSAARGQTAFCPSSARLPTPGIGRRLSSRRQRDVTGILPSRCFSMTIVVLSTSPSVRELKPSACLGARYYSLSHPRVSLASACYAGFCGSKKESSQTQRQVDDNHFRSSADGAVQCLSPGSQPLALQSAIA
jgi:hypothetical protein